MVLIPDLYEPIAIFIKDVRSVGIQVSTFPGDACMYE